MEIVLPSVDCNFIDIPPVLLQENHPWLELHEPLTTISPDGLSIQSIAIVHRFASGEGFLGTVDHRDWATIYGYTTCNSGIISAVDPPFNIENTYLDDFITRNPDIIITHGGIFLQSGYNGRGVFKVQKDPGIYQMWTMVYRYNI